MIRIKLRIMSSICSRVYSHSLAQIGSCETTEIGSCETTEIGSCETTENFRHKFHLATVTVQDYLPFTFTEVFTQREIVLVCECIVKWMNSFLSLDNYIYIIAIRRYFQYVFFSECIQLLGKKKRIFLYIRVFLRKSTKISQVSF